QSRAQRRARRGGGGGTGGAGHFRGTALCRGLWREPSRRLERHLGWKKAQSAYSLHHSRRRPITAEAPMSWDSVMYLIQAYWVFLVIAVLIGVATGWFSAGEPVE